MFAIPRSSNGLLKTLRVRKAPSTAASISSRVQSTVSSFCFQNVSENQPWKIQTTFGPYRPTL